MMELALEIPQKADKTHALYDTTLTPLSLLRRLGVFDFDPCGWKVHPTATEIVELPTNGLSVQWHGRVWLNPPYSDPEPWLKRMAEHVTKDGGSGVSMLLSSTDTGWFHNYIAGIAKGICFYRGRPTFEKIHGQKITLMRASMLVGYSVRDMEALSQSNIGAVMRFTP